jgi:outer membrane biosynthesis protein TonB
MELTALENDRWRFATHPVSRALALSLALHLALFGTLELTRYLKLQLPDWLKTVLDLSGQVSEKKAAAADQEPPTLTFVEVDPASATPEPPKDTKNYSAFNSLAANPDVSIDAEKPKIDGTQDKMPKIEDALRPAPLQPLTPIEPEPQPPKTEAKPDQPPGDLALAKAPDQKPKEEEKPRRPRTLAEVRPMESLIPGRKMKEDGGVKRHGTISAFDAQGTIIGSYDSMLIAAVQRCWYNILDETISPTLPGKVVVEFTLHSDGYVTDVKILETNVGEMPSLFCQRAIEKPAPFGRWPEGMQKELGRNNRRLKFTFYYEY